MNSRTAITTICIVAAILRILYVSIAKDLKSDYYWEYGEIGKNLVAGKGYSLWYFKNDVLEQRFDPAISAFPSAYMPPGYVMFLVPFILIPSTITRNILLVSVQTGVSLFSIVLIWKFTRRFFSERSALIAAVLACVLPEFVFSVVSFTPTVLYHCGVLLFLLLLSRDHELSKRSISIGLGLLASVLILLRPEFMVFLVMTIVVLLVCGERRRPILLLAAILVSTAPWTARNYHVFGELIPTTTSFGLNLYRGNNALPIGSWGDATIAAEIAHLTRNDKFEVSLDRMYSNHALDYIKTHPGTVAIRWFQKIWDLWVLNLHDPTGRSMNTGLSVLSVLLFIAFLIGVVSSWSPSHHLYSYVFFVYFTLTAMVFFVMPRYQTMMQIIVLPFAAYGIEIVWNRIQPILSDSKKHGFEREPS